MPRKGTVLPALPRAASISGSIGRNGRDIGGRFGVEDPGVQHGTLVESGAQSTVKAVLQIELATPLHDMGEKIAIEGRVLGEQ